MSSILTTASSSDVLFYRSTHKIIDWAKLSYTCSQINLLFSTHLKIIFPLRKFEYKCTHNNVRHCI